MKVALVMERLEPWRGGAETSTGQFMRHLVELGVRLEVVTRSQLSSSPGMTVHTVGVSGVTRSGRSAAFARAVGGLVGGLGVDLVHAISPCPCADVYEPRGGTVVETMARNLALRGSKAGRWLKKLANRFNRRQRLMLELERRLLSDEPRPMVVAVSDYVVRQLREHYDFPDSHIRRVFNGVDPDRTDEAERRENRSRIRRRYGIGDDQLLVILVAHNFKLKGVPCWIEALSRLGGGEPVVRSLVIGKGRPGRWRRLAASAGVGDRVCFVGATDSISPYHHAADVLVHPSFYDPCSRVVLEGLVAGLPCITTRFDGAGEVIEDGVSGFVIDDPRAVEVLAERVRRLADPQLRARMGGRAVELAERVSMRRHAEQVLAVYGESAGRRVSG